MNRLIILLATFCIVASHFAYSTQNMIVQAAKSELHRSMKDLKVDNHAPYFISYNIYDVNSTFISASFGKIESFHQDKHRTLDIDLRVGDYEFDNSHIIRGASFSFGSGRFSTELPVEVNEDAIRKAIWYSTDKAFKKAVETYEKALTNKAVKVQEEDTSADFSHEKPETYNGKPINFNYDVEIWKNRLRELSSMFNTEPWIFNGSVSFSAQIIRKIIVNSEGSEMEWFEPNVRVFISARTKAEDGMNLPLYKSYFAFSPDELPSMDVMIGDLRYIIETLRVLKEAPLMSTYSGPAILSGEAAGVFFHEIFGHRVEGHRQKDPNSSQTFKGYKDEKILPDYMDVIFDPSVKEYGNIPLAGYYVYDDQGVRGQTVVSVQNGKFRDFLMSRSPIEDYPNSNGHGRKQPGFSAVSRQSNLIVKSLNTVPVKRLKELLREECKNQNKEFGLYFEVVQGGFTFTGRTVPNAFNVLPLLVYKIFADGRPDEIVRGVDLIGTPLTTFSKVVATGDNIEVFNGMCGAESGNVPVSACSPSLLVSMIEVQRKSKSQAKPPILDAPVEKRHQ